MSELARTLIRTSFGLERAREVTRNGKYTNVEYARFADDLVVLINAYKRHDWLIGAVNKRLREEFAKLQVEINDEKSRRVDLERGENFGFLGLTSATAVCAECLCALARVLEDSALRHRLDR